MSIPDDLRQLFRSIDENLQRTALGPDKWYLLAFATLAGGNDPELCIPLYLWLLEKPEFSTPQQRQALIRRIREALFKAISIVGVCKPLEAIMGIAEVEREEDKDRSSTREGWQCDQANFAKAMDWYDKVYKHNATKTLGYVDDHRDFKWVSQHITYGLYLSDRQILDDIDTEIVVLSGIMIQNLRKETHWHIRGTRRVGVSQADVQIMWDSIQQIAAFLGLKLHRVPTVAEVEPDV